MRRAWIPAGLVLLVLAVYAGVGRFEFTNYDDQVYITNNPHVTAGLTATGIVWAVTTSYAANWHPLTWLSHMTDVQFFGISAGAHHLINLALHVIVTLLVWLVLSNITGASVRSGVVAALFAVHPLHVESVAWVAERKDLLSGLFAMLTIWSYAAYVRRPSRGSYLIALTCFALGLMSKPMLVTLPFVLLLLDVWPLNRPRVWPRLLVEKIPLLILAAASSAITVIAQHRGGALASFDIMPPGARIENGLAAYLIYLQQTIWPAGLAAFYPYASPAPIARAALGAAVLVSITALGMRWRRERPYFLVGWLWFIGTLVPVIGIVQVGAQSHADRYMYLPSIGLFLAVVWTVADLARNARVPARAVGTVAATVVLALTLTARTQARTWKDSIALWEHAASVVPGSSRAHTNLGTSYAAAGREADAIVEYRTALAIEPDLPQAHFNLGLALAQSHPVDAVQEFRETLRLLPDHLAARNSLANTLMDLGRFDEALNEYSEALRRQPDDAQIHHNLGVAFAQLGRMQDATREFLEAVRLDPNRAELQYSAGMAFVATGDYARAAEFLHQALKLDPTHERARKALADIGR